MVQLTEVGPVAMAIIFLPPSPPLEARVLLHHLLDHGDIVGRDTAGWTIFQLAVEDRVMETADGI